MKKTILGVAMVVVFCITWWLVAGGAWLASNQAEQARIQLKEEAITKEKAWYIPDKATLTDLAKDAVNNNIITGLATEAVKKAGSDTRVLQQIKKIIKSMRGSNKFQVAAVVVLLGAWWLVAGEEWQAFTEAKQTSTQALEASIAADAHFRTRAAWGIGAGLLADVLLLVGALAWSKLTAKS